MPEIDIYPVDLSIYKNFHPEYLQYAGRCIGADV